MTKDEIALELAKHFSGLVPITTSSESAKNVVDFYNTIFDGIKTEYYEKRKGNL